MSVKLSMDTGIRGCVKLIRNVDTDLVLLTRDRKAVTTSRVLAERFRKRHKDVLAIIDGLKERHPDKLNGPKLRPGKYKDAKGELRREYVFDRDVFVFVVMAFSGKRAENFKWDFIQAFNKMESWIRQRLENSLEYKIMSDTLREVRTIQGKETSPHHYTNEARLINWVLTGRFSAIDRESLPAEDLDLLLALQQRNSVLIGAGMEYRDRKEALRIFCALRKDKEVA